MKLYEVFLKEDTTNIIVRAENEVNALKVFKAQRLHFTGVSKSDYSVKELV